MSTTTQVTSLLVTLKSITDSKSWIAEATNIIGKLELLEGDSEAGQMITTLRNEIKLVKKIKISHWQDDLTDAQGDWDDLKGDQDDEDAQDDIEELTGLVKKEISRLEALVAQLTATYWAAIVVEIQTILRSYYTLRLEITGESIPVIDVPDLSLIHI